MLKYKMKWWNNWMEWIEIVFHEQVYVSNSLRFLSILSSILLWLFITRIASFQPILSSMTF